MKAFWVGAAIAWAGLGTAGAAPPALPYEHGVIRPNETLVGELTSSDQLAPDSSRYDDFRIFLYSGQCIEATLRSEAFDTFVSIYRGDTRGSRAAFDDDGASAIRRGEKASKGGDSQVRFCADREGFYRIRANSYHPAEFGAYSLSVRIREDLVPEVYEIQLGATKGFRLDPVRGARFAKGRREESCKLPAPTPNINQLNRDEEQLYLEHRFVNSIRAEEFLIEVETEAAPSRDLVLEAFVPLRDRDNGVASPAAAIAPVACNDDWDNSPDPRMVYRANPDAGEHFVRVSGRLESDFGPYQLTVTPLHAQGRPPRPKSISRSGLETGAFALQSPRDRARGAPYKDFKLKVQPGQTYRFSYGVQTLYPRLEILASTAAGYVPVQTVSCPPNPPGQMGTTDQCTTDRPNFTQLSFPMTFTKKGEVLVRATTVSPVSRFVNPFELRVERVS